MKLFVSVPTHSETMAAETVHTIVAAQSIACKRGWRFYFHHFAAAVIGDVRNIIAATFLESGADVLLMIDADQAASAATIEGMLDFNKPFVGCICPRRQYYWPQASLAGAASVDALRYQALRFVGYLEEDEQGRAEIVDGFGRATFVGAGLMVLHRSVFERMMEHYPEIEGKGFDLAFQPSVSSNWASSTRWTGATACSFRKTSPFAEDGRRWAARSGRTSRATSATSGATIIGAIISTT